MVRLEMLDIHCDAMIGYLVNSNACNTIRTMRIVLHEFTFERVHNKNWWHFRQVHNLELRFGIEIRFDIEIGGLQLRKFIFVVLTAKT